MIIYFRFQQIWLVLITGMTNRLLPIRPSVHVLAGQLVVVLAQPSLSRSHPQLHARILSPFCYQYTRAHTCTLTLMLTSAAPSWRNCFNWTRSKGARGKFRKPSPLRMWGSRRVLSGWDPHFPKAGVVARLCNATAATAIAGAATSNKLRCICILQTMATSKSSRGDCDW